MVSTAAVTWPEVGEGGGLDVQALPQKMSWSLAISITTPPLSWNLAAPPVPGEIPAGPAGLASTFPVTPAVLTVGARGESAGAALDREAAFIMATSQERRAQYPGKQRLGEKWGLGPNGITVGAGLRVEAASGRDTAAVVPGCQRRPGLWV